MTSPIKDTELFSHQCSERYSCPLEPFELASLSPEAPYTGLAEGLGLPVSALLQSNKHTSAFACPIPCHIDQRKRNVEGFCDVVGCMGCRSDSTLV